MQSYIAALALAGGASAAVLPRQQAGCCFQLTASGGQSGQVSQLSDGQNRIHGSGSPATYCLNNGQITDSTGRGCILTPPTSQFQCDTGASPSGGFSIGSSGEVEHNGSGAFYACGATDTAYNIYTQPVSGQANCVEISLSSGGKCAGSGNGNDASASSAASSDTAASVPVTASSAPAQSAPIYGHSSSQLAASSPASASSTPAQSAPSYGQGSSAPAQSVQTSQPKPVTSQPAVETSQPAVETSQPAVATSQASVKTSQPTVETSQPALATSQASVQTSQPSIATSQPAVVTSQPAIATSQASVVTSQPAVASSQAYIPAYASQLSSSTLATSQPAAQSSIPAVSSSAPAYFSQQSQPAPSSSETSTVSASAGSFSTAQTPAPQVTSDAPAGSLPPQISSTGVVSASNGPSATGTACSPQLTGSYATPNAIIPVSSQNQNQAYGTSYNGQINSTTSTIFNFDIPASYAGKQCSIVFLFPQQQNLETSSYTFSGSGSIGFSQLSSAAQVGKTSYSNVPSVGQDFGSITVQPGNSYVVANQQCQAGKTESIELSSEGGLALNFFEDWNPSSLGLYITSC